MGFSWRTIPAAGGGTRIAPIPGSKEVFPIGFADTDSDEPKVKVVSQYLFDRMASAGVRQGIIVLRVGKWDIPAYFGEGGLSAMRLAYVVVGETLGPPDTLDRAYAFVRRNVVAFGFPEDKKRKHVNRLYGHSPFRPEARRSAWLVSLA